MTVTITRPVRSRPAFHPLPVAAVDRLTDDAVAVTFTVPPELRETFGAVEVRQRLAAAGLCERRIARAQAIDLLWALDRRDRATDDRTRYRHSVPTQAGTELREADAGAREPVLGGSSRPHLAPRRRR